MMIRTKLSSEKFRNYFLVSMPLDVVMLKVDVVTLYAAVVVIFDAFKQAIDPLSQCTCCHLKKFNGSIKSKDLHQCIPMLVKTFLVWTKFHFKLQGEATIVMEH